MDSSLPRYELLAALLALLLLPAPLIYAGADRSLIANGDFDENIAQWSTWYAPGQAEGQAKWVERGDGGAMHIQIDRTDSSSAVQIFQGPFRVQRGNWYSVTFEAKAPQPIELRVALMRNNPPWGTFGLNADLTIDTEWQQYGLLCQATETSTDARIDFFPAGTFLLDSIAVRPVGTRPEMLPIQRITAGPGWQGDPAKLLDADTKTFLQSNYYPRLPIAFTADLGKMMPVGAVLLEGEDRGRHTRIRTISVQVSANGNTWYRWATAVRTATAADGWARPVSFLATNVAAPARYVRVQVDRLQARACLSEMRVAAAQQAAESSLASLPQVHPADSITFIGWDYDRLGYAAGPGEQLGLRFANPTQQALNTDCHWHLETFAGEPVTDQRRAALSLPAGGEGGVPLTLPDRLPDGPYRVRFRLANARETQGFYFDYRVADDHPTLGLKLAALLDSQASEGWLTLICGPLKRFVDVRASLPDDPSRIDAAIVMAEQMGSDSPMAGRLREYLHAGGNALFFAKVTPQLADILPVEIDYDDPWLSEPQSLVDISFWPDFDPALGPKHYGVRVSAKTDASVLAHWADGAPAVVQGTYGSGKVLYIGAAPGRLWQRNRGLRDTDELTLRAIYHLLGRQEAPQALMRFAGESAARLQRRTRDAVSRAAPDAPDAAREGESAGNFGRFGWKVAEGHIVENLSADCSMRCPASPSPWSVVVPGSETLTGMPVAQNWIAKHTSWRDDGAEVLRSIVSLASPLILWEGDAEAVHIRSDATHIVFRTSGGMRVVTRGTDVDPNQLTAPWLVLLNANEDVRDAPKLLILAARPGRIRFADALQLHFADRQEQGFGTLWTGRLFGITKLAPGEAAKWTRDFPPRAADQAHRLARQCLRYPTAAKEVYWMENDTVVIADRFEYRETESAWDVEPQTVAALPPILSLVRKYSPAPPAVDGEVIDLDMPTKHGPLQVVEGPAVRYRLTLPPHDHFGVIPAEGKMELTDEIDHYGVRGTDTVNRASGGLTTGYAFLEDLRRYMSSGGYDDPFAAPCIDLYKWWYCFPAVCGKPAFSPDARRNIDRHYHTHYWRTLNFYPHKALIRYRREPWTGLDYTISFIWPVMWQDGTRYFVDQNESAAVIMYCLWAYSQYYGDWDTVASNWNLVRYLHNYLPRCHDWAFMASSNQEFFSTVGIDMLNAEYPGNLALARMAEQVGDERTEALGTYLAAKAAMPAVARLFMPDYIESVTAPGDPWRDGKFYWHLQETGFRASPDMIMRGDTQAILGLAIGFLDTSKGTSPEVCMMYKHYAPGRMDAYEQAVKRTEEEYDVPAGWAHLMNRAFLGWPRDQLIATAKEGFETYNSWGWQMTKAPHNLAAVCAADSPVFLADWAPAEYVTGSYDPEGRSVRLHLRNTSGRPARIRMYSRQDVSAVRVNGEHIDNWQYDDGSGILQIEVTAQGEVELQVALRAGASAPPHPYLAPIAER